MSEEWLKDKYAQKWFSEISDRTANNCKTPFSEWLDFIKMTPTEQIERRVKDLQSPNPQVRRFFEDKLIQWKNSLVDLEEDGKRKYSKSAIVTKLQRVMSFFSHNNVRLMFARGQLSVEPAAREKVKLKWVPKNTEVKMLYKHGDVRDRPLLLVLYQSGFSEVDVSSLNIQDLPEIYTCEGNHYIAMLREKTNILQQTCISMEAIHDLRVMLRERGNPEKGTLFESQKGKRLSVRFMNDAIKRLAEKTFGEEKAKDFKTKNLRDAYKNGLLRAHLDREIVDKMFGHKRTGAKEAYQLEQALIEESYDKAFKFLSINSGLQAKADLQRIEQSMIGLSRTVAKQQEQMIELAKMFVEAEKGKQVGRKVAEWLAEVVEAQEETIEKLKKSASH